jgi:hypothetical protein
MSTIKNNFSKYKILFVGVFDTTGKSTNTSQLLTFKHIGMNVAGYQYRQKATSIGPKARDVDLINTIKEGEYDLTIFSKGNGISNNTFKEASKYTKTCLWFMDPLVSYTTEMQEKTSLVDFSCFDKKNVLKKAQTLSDNVFYVCEGFDSLTDKPYPKELPEHDVGFIGNIYGDREFLLSQIKQEVKVSNNVFGFNHPKLISQTKINLNFCTDKGASDRVYRIMGAQGFLLSDDWDGREECFEDKKDLVIYKNIEDLNRKIDYYLKNEDERLRIAKRGYETVQKFNRVNWAKKIVEIYETI